MATVTTNSPGLGRLRGSDLPWKEPRLSPYSVTVDGSTDSADALQTILDSDDLLVPKGIVLIKSGLFLEQPAHIRGRGPKSVLRAASDFASGEDMITLSPASGTEKRGWRIEDLIVDNAGTAVGSVIAVDITDSGQYLSKLTVKGVIADTVSGYFFELINPTNVDGLFTSTIEDCWSLNGYYLDRIGDSFFVSRCTVTGAGVAFYVNQISTASNIGIRDCNITSAGGALNCIRSKKLLFQNNQCEITPTFTGTNDAAVNIDNPGATVSHFGFSVVQNNINTHDNETMRCVYVDYCLGGEIASNNLSCYPSTGTHIYIGSNASDVYVGPNNYFSSTNGVEIAPLITDNGIGTMGLWKAATLITDWTLTSPSTGFPVGYFKSRDGLVSLRGWIGGATKGSAELLFTLPVGFRPKTKVSAQYKPITGSVSVYIQIEPAGNVYLITTGVASVNLESVTFSTR